MSENSPRTASDPGLGGLSRGFEMLALVLIFGVLFSGFRDLAFANYVNTIQLHISSAELFLLGDRYIPHAGYHLFIGLVHLLTGFTFEWAAAFTLSTSVVLSILLIKRQLRTGDGGRNSAARLLLAIVVVLCAAIYIPEFSASFTHGTGAVSVWQNSTMLFCRPIAILAFVAFMGSVPHAAREPVLRKSLFAGLLLAISVYAKPNFALVFVPAAGIWLLFKRCWTLPYVKAGLAAILPALFVLAAQYFLTFHTSEGGRSIGFDTFRVWHRKAPDIAAVLLLALAFPLSILVFRAHRLKHDAALQVSWLMMLFGILERGLLKENEHALAGNWAWGFMFAMTFVFIYSTRELLVWRTEPGQTRRSLLALEFCTLLLGFHLLSGLAYFVSKFWGMH